MSLQILFYIVLILLLVLGVKLLWATTSMFVDKTQYRVSTKRILDAHKSIGYPKLSNELQFYILDTEDTKSIAALVNITKVPLELLNKYITVTPDEYLQHLYAENLMVKKKFNPDELIDGFYIRETKMGYDYMFVDRRSAMKIRSFKNYDRLLRYIVFHKLRLYVPERNGFIKTKLWCIIG